MVCAFRKTLTPFVVQAEAPVPKKSVSSVKRHNSKPSGGKGWPVFFIPAPQTLFVILFPKLIDFRFDRLDEVP
jgi:hypothetical protein